MKITEEELKQMYLAENMTIDEIAEETGISRRQICNYIKYWGLFKRGSGIKEKRQYNKTKE